MQERVREQRPRPRFASESLYSRPLAAPSSSKVPVPAVPGRHVQATILRSALLCSSGSTMRTRTLRTCTPRPRVRMSTSCSSPCSPCLRSSYRNDHLPPPPPCEHAGSPPPLTNLSRDHAYRSRYGFLRLQLAAQLKPASALRDPKLLEKALRGIVCEP